MIMKNKKNSSFIFHLIVCFLLVVSFQSCTSDETKEEKIEKVMISKDMLISIFGNGGGSTSGLIDFAQSSDELQISYYLYIEDMSIFDEEIEKDLAPKIQAMYQKFPEIDRTAFTVNVPRTGEVPYRPYVSFAVTRKLVEETNWMNLLELEFFKVVMEVKFFE